jgi:hypothetical protein
LLATALVGFLALGNRRDGVAVSGKTTFTRMSRFATVAGVLLLAGWTAAAAPVTGRPALAPCRLSQFVVSLGSFISEATGQHTLALRLVNYGATPCALDGYPRVTLYDAAGAIPFVVRHRGDQMITSRPPSKVLVRQGQAAFVALNKYRCDTQSFRVTTRISLRAAGAWAATAAVSITFRKPLKDPFASKIPVYCGKGHPGSIVTVSPFVPTVRAAMAH